MTQEALKLSQEALAGLKDVKKQVRELIAENKALKEALAQTQEPVVKLKTSNMLLRCHRCGCSDKLNIQIEYTYPPQRTWVGLTEDERDHLTGLHLYAVRGQVEAWIEGVDDFAQAIEAKLKEKNGFAEEKNT